jgi:hypothetical protein
MQSVVVCKEYTLNPDTFNGPKVDCWVDGDQRLHVTVYEDEQGEKLLVQSEYHSWKSYAWSTQENDMEVTQ